MANSGAPTNGAYVPPISATAATPMHRVNAKPRRNHVCVATWDPNGNVNVKPRATQSSSLRPQAIMRDDRKPVPIRDRHKRLLHERVTGEKVSADPVMRHGPQGRARDVSGTRDIAAPHAIRYKQHTPKL